MRRFPQARKLSLVELGTHVEVAMVVRSSAHGEQSMFAGLFRHLTSVMLLLWDRGFFSYELWQQMTVRTVKVFARVKSGLFCPIHHLADGSYLAKISWRPPVGAPVPRSSGLANRFR